MLLYLDTCVVMDFLLNRRESTKRVILDAVSCKYRFIVSDHLLQELQGNQLFEPSTLFFKMLHHKTIRATITQQDHDCASTMNNPFSDALHASIALRTGADALLTENFKDFQGIPNLRIITSAMLT